MFDDPEKNREELIGVIDEIRSVLGEDLKDFPARTAKKRYLAHPEFAATLTAEQLGNLKAALLESGKSRSDEILTKLNDERVWLEDVSPTGGKASKSLRENRAVTEMLSAIAENTRAVLEEYGFPEALLEIHYETPTWFIKGRYLPGLIEKYWRCLGELQQHGREHKRAQYDHDLQMLAERWENS